MEHIEIINRIIEAEHRAQSIANAAREKQVRLANDLADERRKIRDELYARANRRIGLVREHEENVALEQIAALDQKLKGDMETLENSYHANRKRWLDELFQSIAGTME